MVENSEWVVPRFRGEPFLDKPILYFWAQMVSLKSFGMNEFAVRLPGLLFGLLGAVTTGLLAGRLFDSKTGLYAFLMSLTMFLPLALAQAAAHDVALVPWTNLALLCLWEMERGLKPAMRTRWMAAAACMIALAILTKALIGIAIVGIGFGTFLIVSRSVSIGSCLRVAIVFTFGVVMASPWFIAMEIRNNGYLYYYFIERHVLGFATSGQPHGRAPWYYYAPFVTLGAMPWIWYLVPLLRDEWNDRKASSESRPAVLLLVAWFLGGLFFLCTAKSKLATYALPLFPAISILSAVSWRRMSENLLSAVSKRWFGNMCRSAGFVGVAAPFAVLLLCQFLLKTDFPGISWLIAAAISATSAATWMAFNARDYNNAVALLSVWVAGITCLAMTWPLQIFAENYSERNLAEWINKQQAVPRHVVLVGEKPGSVIFYLDHSLREQLQLDQMERMTLEELPANDDLADNVVLAVTQSMVEEARLKQLPIPGHLTHSTGQFHIFEPGTASASSGVQLAVFRPDGERSNE